MEAATGRSEGWRKNIGLNLNLRSTKPKPVRPRPRLNFNFTTFSCSISVCVSREGPGDMSPRGAFWAPPHLTNSLNFDPCSNPRSRKTSGSLRKRRDCKRLIHFDARIGGWHYLTRDLELFRKVGLARIGLFEFLSDGLVKQHPLRPDQNDRRASSGHCQTNPYHHLSSVFVRM